VALWLGGALGWTPVSGSLHALMVRAANAAIVAAATLVADFIFGLISFSAHESISRCTERVCGFDELPHHPSSMGRHIRFYRCGALLRWHSLALRLGHTAPLP